ncbi:hypothetical protein CSB93_2438 [Pseudomonas paraeruginosa]|uniref:Uncharacterized protein n=1 Tax=Pseudomonas paraeruginosa TaxID=2994495 RepID=A0A2R3J0A2_9PSED|nr:hypothetical protein CSB93_2438 [Pseudomonas paraeruginosa]AWE93261.1 hypothetical protein CSC28_1206 [Pseudomonas paraeruginosa]
MFRHRRVPRHRQKRRLYVHLSPAPSTRGTLFPGCSRLLAVPNHFESFPCRFR